MRLADDDQLTARLQFERTIEVMAECRPPLSPCTLRAELQQVCLRKNLSKPRDPRRDPKDMQQPSRSQVLLPITRSPIIGGDHDSSIFDSARQLDGYVAADAIHPVVEISPAEAVARLTVTGYGMVAESVRIQQPRQNPTSFSGSNAYARDVREGRAARRRNFRRRFAAISAPEPREEADIRAGWPRISRLARAARVADAAHVLLLRT